MNLFESVWQLGTFAIKYGYHDVLAAAQKLNSTKILGLDEP